MKIRYAHQEDLDFIKKAQVLMAKETENLSLDPKIVSMGVDAAFHDPAKGSYLVTEIDNQVVACLLTLNEWSDWRNGNVLWIHSVYVSQDYRGQGIYKKMYEFLVEKVKASKDLRGLRLYVDKTNQKAIAVYSKLKMSNEHYELFEWLKDY